MNRPGEVVAGLLSVALAGFVALVVTLLVAAVAAAAAAAFLASSCTIMRA